MDTEGIKVQELKLRTGLNFRLFDVDFENSISVTGLVAALVFSLAIVALFLILVGNGAHGVAQYFDFQTGQPIASFGSSMIGLGDGILAVLIGSFVVVVITWAYAKSQEGGDGYY